MLSAKLGKSAVCNLKKLLGNNIAGETYGIASNKKSVLTKCLWITGRIDIIGLPLTNVYSVIYLKKLGGDSLVNWGKSGLFLI